MYNNDSAVVLFKRERIEEYQSQVVDLIHMSVIEK